jgi:hypothetical protein
LLPASKYSESHLHNISTFQKQICPLQCISVSLQNTGLEKALHKPDTTAQFSVVPPMAPPAAESGRMLLWMAWPGLLSGYPRAVTGQETTIIAAINFLIVETLCKKQPPIF